MRNSSFVNCSHLVNNENFDIHKKNTSDAVFHNFFLLFAVIFFSKLKKCKFWIFVIFCSALELWWLIRSWIIYMPTFPHTWTVLNFWVLFPNLKSFQTSSKACEISSLTVIDIASLRWLFINTVSHKIKLAVDATKTSNADEAWFRDEIEIGWHFHTASIFRFTWPSNQ